MSQSQKMRNALEEYVISGLRAKGFEGKYPHYSKIYDDRIELLVFQTNNLRHSFTVEISSVFKPERKRNSNFSSGDFKNIEDATVWDTNIRYRLKGMYDGWFYYTDLYCQKIGFLTLYNAIGETKSKNYIPAENERIVQKADEDIYYRICDEVNMQMEKAFKWWDAFNKNNKIKMKLLEFF